MSHHQSGKFCKEDNGNILAPNNEVNRNRRIVAITCFGGQAIFILGRPLYVNSFALEVPVSSLLS